MRNARLVILGAIVLALAIFAAYRPALDAGYVWDDQDYVVANDNLVRPDGLRRIWFEPRRMVQYYPLVHTALWLQYRLWKLEPRGYHVVNVLLHAANALLLWLVLARLAIPGAWFIAALFGLHPLQVESVAWITEIKNVLSTLFYLLAVWAYLRFRDTRAGVESGGDTRTGVGAGGNTRLWYGAALGLFLLALFSKTTAVTLPLALLVLVWWKTPVVRRSDLLPLVPMFVLAAAFGGFTWWLETHHVGSENVVVFLSIWDKLLVPARAAWFYAAKLVWPADLSFVYPRWQVNPGVWWQYLFPIAALAVLVAAWRLRTRFGKGPFAAIAFFALTLAPVAGFVRFYFLLYSFVADHFQYLASVGLLALAVAPAARWIERRQASPAVRLGLGRAMPAVLLVILAALTWNRTRVYRNEETLWRDTLAKNPSAWIAHNNLGVVLQNTERKDEAAVHFAAALQLNPNSPESHANLGVLYQDRGDAAHAIESYRQAVTLKPILVDMQYNLGVLLMQRGDLAEASEHFTQALKYRPTMVEAHLRLGDILVQQGQLDAALERYRGALAIDPAANQIHHRIGWVLATQGSFGDARGYLAEAVRRSPKDAEAHALLGVVLENLGDRAGAIARYRRALELSPQIDLAQQGLARLAPQD